MKTTQIFSACWASLTFLSFTAQLWRPGAVGQPEVAQQPFRMKKQTCSGLKSRGQGKPGRRPCLQQHAASWNSQRKWESSVEVRRRTQESRQNELQLFEWNQMLGVRLQGHVTGMTGRAMPRQPDDASLYSEAYYCIWEKGFVAGSPK